MNKTIALLSNINIAPLQNALQTEGFSEVYVAGYNQWQSELLNPGSGLYTASPDYLFLYLHPGEWLKGSQPIDEITTSIGFFLENSLNTTVLVCEMVSYPLSTSTYIESKTDTDYTFCRELMEFCSQSKRTRLVRFSELVILHGYKTIFDEKYWYLGRMKFSLEGYRLMAQELRRLINALEGTIRKVLVLDLDNTLWGGVLGEDGLAGIQLSSEGKGLIYKEFQQICKDLLSSGVVLSVCSKNNEEEVRAAFANHPDMVLHWDDFAAHRVNWLPKHENLQSIANELNLGLDSLVFIDDSAAERELVSRSLPLVAVPEFPADITQLKHWLYDKVIYTYFARTTITSEDKGKAAQYKRNAFREQERSQISFEAFIQGLNIRVNVEPATEHTLARIAQLTQKTNQFNTSLKRYNEAETVEMYKSDNWKLYTCSYRDKFGDEGIVGAFLVHIKKQEACIDNFVVSCRALGRKAEYTLLKQLVGHLRELDCTLISAQYTPGDRNTPAAGVYKTYGFDEVAPNEYKLQI